MLGHRDADVDAGPARELGRRAAGVLDRGARGVEQDALLRVHEARAARQDAEELGRELVDVVDAGQEPGVGAVRRARVGIVERAMVPAVGRHLARGDPAGLDQLPEPGQVGRAGEARAHPHDRDGFSHWMCPASFSQVRVGSRVSRAERKLTPSSRCALLESTNQ